MADTLRVATLGDSDAQLRTLNLAQRPVPLVVRLDDASRRDPAQLERMRVPGCRGPVMLGRVAPVGRGGGAAVG
ncbi:MAG: hypothetical protein ACKOBF_11245, partial [Limnohabitans sp.]